MSHFFVGAIVDDPENVDKKLKELMAPYDENIEVEPYERDCYCIGSKARKEVRENIEKKFNNIDEIRKKFSQTIDEIPEVKKDSNWLMSKDGDKKIQRMWDELIKPRMEAEKMMLENHQLAFLCQIKII